MADVSVPVRIESPEDPRVDDYREMRDPAARRAREGDSFLLAEGANVVRRLARSGLRVRSVLLADSRLAPLHDVVEPLLGAGTPVFVASREVIAGITGFDLHRGVVAAADRPVDPGLEAVVDRAVASGGTIAVLEGLNDHENLGAIARSARALGIEALVLDATCADPWYRRTVRTSMGEVLSLPVTRVPSTAAAVAALRARGVTIAALTPQSGGPGGPAVDIHGWRRPPGALAVVLGAEGPGLTTETMATSDVRLRIPIAADVDSLNVGHAAAIAFALLGR